MEPEVQTAQWKRERSPQRHRALKHQERWGAELYFFLKVQVHANVLGKKVGNKTLQVCMGVWKAKLSL